MSGTIGLWTAVAISIRYLDGRVPYFELSFLRALFSMCLMLPLVLRFRAVGGSTSGRFFPNSRTAFGQYGLRGGAVFFAQAMFYYAVTRMGLAEATVLNATTPIFGALLAFVLLAERVDRMRCLAIALGFIGVVIILRPGFAEISLPAWMSLASAALFAWSSVLNKSLVQAEPASRIVFLTNIVVVALGIGPFLVIGTVPRLSDVPLILAFCGCGAVAQYCLSRALALADASFVQPFEFLRVPMSAVAGLVLFAQFPDALVWVGSAIVFLAIFALARSRGGSRSAA